MIAGNRKQYLPSAKEYQPVAETVNVSKLPRDLGVVKYFNIANGVGIASTHYGEVHIHWSNFVNNGTGIIWPQPGQRFHWSQIRRGRDEKLQEAFGLRLESW